MGSPPYTQVSLSSPRWALQCPCPKGGPEGTSRCRNKRSCDRVGQESFNAEAEILRDDLLQKWATLSGSQRRAKTNRLVELCLCGKCLAWENEFREKLFQQLCYEHCNDHCALPDTTNSAARAHQGPAIFEQVMQSTFEHPATLIKTQQRRAYTQAPSASAAQRSYTTQGNVHLADLGAFRASDVPNTATGLMSPASSTSTFGGPGTNRALGYKPNTTQQTQTALLGAEQEISRLRAENAELRRLLEAYDRFDEVVDGVNEQPATPRSWRMLLDAWDRVKEVVSTVRVLE